MRTGLSPADLAGLLDEPRLAILATHRRDGSVLLSPVWHRFEDDGFTIATYPDDVKLRHIALDPRVSIVVAEDAPPYRGFEIRGEAREVDRPFPATMRGIGRRYVGDEVDAVYPDGTPGVVLRIEGVHRGWDFVDDYGSMLAARSAS